MPDCWGSGTVIGVTPTKALILSCRHVCQSPGRPVKAWFIWNQGQEVQGRVLEIIPGNGFGSDLALVEVDRPLNVTPVPVAQLDLKQGPWVAAGFRNAMLRVSIGTAGRYEDGLLIFNSPMVGGMSGGPVFNRYGHVVAVAVASDRATTGVAVDGPRLHALLKRYSK